MKKKFTRILGVGVTIALLTSLIVVATPAMAITQPAVSFATPADSTISKPDADYTIHFKLGKEISANATDQDSITITFPSDTLVEETAEIVATIAAGPGWIGGGWYSANLTSANWTSNPELRTVTYTLDPNDAVGEAAEVRIAITEGISNPSASGSYTLTVETSKELPVTSATYIVEAPYIPPLAGLVARYNPADVLMNQWIGPGAIGNAVADANPGDTIKIGPGVYNESPDTNDDSVRYVATGTAAETIITGTWTIDNLGITLEGFTVQGTVNVAAGTSIYPTVIKNCVLSNVPPTYPGEVLIDQSSGYLKVQDCEFNTVAGVAADTGMHIGTAEVVVTGSSLALGSANDIGINVDGSGNVTVTNCSITGGSGVGYKTLTGSKATITDSSFDGLEKAVHLADAATLTLRGCAITNSTNPTATTFGYAVDIDGATSVLIENNDIENNAGFSVGVAASANASNITVIGNSFVGNGKGLYSEAAQTLNAVLNWWGAASGPTHVMNVGGTGDAISGAGIVNYRPWAMAVIPDVATGDIPADGTLDVSATVGIVYTSSAATTGIALARYISNPAALDPPYAALPEGYYDVYAPSAGGTNTLKFYNAAVTPETGVYYWSEVAGAWSTCSEQGVAGTGAYVWVRVTPNTLPSNVELSGTPFVLVDVPASPLVELSSPQVGGYNVSIQPTFTWTVAPGAIRYEIALAEDPTFAIIEWSYNVDDFFYKAEEDLRYSTTYYWRVRAVTGEPYQAGFPPVWVTPAGPWATGIFTTEAEPVEAPEPITDITVESPDVTVTPGEVTVDVAPAVPDVMLWAIVGIGAVLIIALIVLIVRTRRVA